MSKPTIKWVPILRDYRLARQHVGLQQSIVDLIEWWPTRLDLWDTRTLQNVAMWDEPPPWAVNVHRQNVPKLMPLPARRTSR